MKAFNHTNAKTLAETTTALLSGKAVLIAGGTGLIVRPKDDILPTYPASVINIKTITASLESIKEEGGVLKIGATTRLAGIAASEAFNRSLPLWHRRRCGLQLLTFEIWEQSEAISHSCAVAGTSANLKTASTASAREAPPALR